MKNIKFLFLLVATLVAGTFTACQQEWEPGQPDTDLSVYFPVEVEYASFAAVDNDETEIDEAHTWLISNFLVRPASSSGAPGRPGTPPDHAGESTLLSRSGGETGLR